MSQNNRGYNIPAFGHTSHISSRSKSRISEDNEEEIDLEVALSSNISSATNKSRHRQIKNSSHITTKSSSKSITEANVQPMHDPAGKPLRRHGTETIGDILMHPIKEMQLYQKRNEAYEAEKNAWNEKHPESIASKHDDTTNAEPDVRVRLTMHFRHLVGEQHFKFTDEQIATLEKPLKLTEKEKEMFKKFHDTDDFIDFLEETKRDFSVKVHKTVKLKQQLANAKSELFHDSSKSSFDLGEKSNVLISETTTASTAKPGDIKHSDTHPSLPKSDSGNFDDHHKLYPHKTGSPTDLLMDLNDNVYIQVQFIKVSHEHEEKIRKAIFLVPDPDLSDEVDQHTSATWIELLGDVFYVGWLSQFTHSVEIDSMESLNIYAAWFVVMWWTWCSSALYSSRYDTQDVAHHVYKIIELCGLIIMAGSSEREKFLSPKWFIIGYMIMKAELLFQYLVIFAVSLGAHFKSSRRPLGMYVAGCAIALAMWGVSLLYTSEADMSKRYALWYVSIVLELVIHVMLQGNSRVTLKASHLGERFGLFTLIILGENCMGFIKMVAENESTSSVIACNVFGVTIIFCYFFMYFDDFSGEFNSETKLSQLWMYLHFPLHLLQVAFGIALTQIIDLHSQHKDTVLGTEEAYAVCHNTTAVTHTTSETTAPASTTEATTEHHAKRMLLSLAAAESSHASGETCEDPIFSVKLFWITAGLILCFNAFIKLVNTPLTRGSFRAYIICASRILNAVIFFALSTITFANLNGLSMVSIMMACLLFQSGVDLLD